MGFDLGGFATGVANSAISLVSRDGVGRDLKNGYQTADNLAHFASGAGPDAISRWLSDPVNVENMARATFSEADQVAVIARHQYRNQNKLSEAARSMFSLATPKSFALKDPMRSYLWSFWIKEDENYPELRAVFKRIQSCNIPGMQFEAIQKSVANQTFSMAGAKTVNAINLKLYDDAQGTIKSLQYLYEWMGQIQDPSTGGIYPPSHYKKTGVIAVYRPVPSATSPGDATVMFVKVHGVWPSSINDIQLDYESSGLFTIDVTLTADRIGTAYFANPTDSKGFASVHNPLMQLVPPEVTSIQRGIEATQEAASAAVDLWNMIRGDSPQTSTGLTPQAVHEAFTGFDSLRFPDPDDGGGSVLSDVTRFA